MSEPSHDPIAGDPQAAATYVVGFIGIILMLAVMILTVVLFQNTERREDQEKIYAAKPQELADLQFQQLARINERRMVDPNGGTIAIPIDDAIALYVNQVKAPRLPTSASGTRESP
jgi:hypothetical protein